MGVSNLSDKLIVFALSSFIIASAGSCVAEEGAWSPILKFSVDGSNSIETLTFISGLAYGLQSTDMELKKVGTDNFFCVTSSDEINSRTIIELLNKKISGDTTADDVVYVLVSELKVKYPCPDPD